MIGLMDCNNFFVSCERLFRPDLKNRPVAVLSSNDGCVVARSQEVKDLGIPMGIPYFKVKEICDEGEVVLFSSNFPFYRDISERVMRVLNEEVPEMQIYSVDEAFFSVPDTYSLEEARALRARIVGKTGIPVSIGISSTKTLAKVAGDYAKRGPGAYILTKDLWKEEQENVKCGSIWGIGRETTEKLRDIGVKSVGDLLSLDKPYLKKRFGVVGERMLMELGGIAVSAVGEGHETKNQSLMSTRSFRRAITEKMVLESALGHHVTHLGEKLRARGLTASYLRVIAAPGRHGDYALRKGSADTKLLYPTNNTGTILKESLKLLDSLYDPEIPYKRAGIVLGGIIPTACISGNLFDQGYETEDLLLKTIDQLNDRFGSGTVRPGVILETEKWKASAELRSQEYTTKWDQIAIVKAVS